MRRTYLPHGWDYRSRDVDNGTKSFLSPEQVSNHAVARARMSLIVGVDLALMRASNIVPPGASVERKGAKTQDDRGTHPDGTHAAHALPCGITINRTLPYDLSALRGRANLAEFIRQPYDYTNVVPRALNNADSRAEGYSRTDGTGLVTNFIAFCSQVLAHAPVHKGRVNQPTFRMIFAEQIRGWQESLEIALASKPPVQTGGPTGNALPKLSYSDAEFHEDNIRTALRGQARTLRELGPSLFSPILVEQVESDFHSVSGQGGNSPAR